MMLNAMRQHVSPRNMFAVCHTGSEGREAVNLRRVKRKVSRGEKLTFKVLPLSWIGRVAVTDTLHILVLAPQTYNQRESTSIRKLQSGERSEGELQRDLLLRVAPEQRRIP